MILAERERHATCRKRKSLWRIAFARQGDVHKLFRQRDGEVQ